ncbi:MAG: DedA family protein, partial [Caldimonas sp.]
RFAVFNMIGAAIWAVAVSGAGYLFGHAIEWFLADLELLEKWALVGLLAVVVMLLTVRWFRSRSKV